MDLLKTSEPSLNRSIRRGGVTVTVVGAGHVGLPLAVALASIGAKVHTVTKTRQEAEAISRGRPLFYEPGLNAALASTIKSRRLKATSHLGPVAEESSLIFICVGTPVDERGRPDLRGVKDVCRTIGEKLARGKLVILRSTVPPGFTRGTAEKILEGESQLSAKDQFGLAFCPERLVEGRALDEMISVPQIIGGTNHRSSMAACRIFKTLGGKVVLCPSPEVAEMAKLFDNVFRDVNIALANELALICESVKVNVMDVRRACNTGPRTRVLVPGAGTGGSCLNKDPYMLMDSAMKAGARPKLIPIARKVNEEMPFQTIQRIRDAFGAMLKRLRNGKVTVLGLAFKRDTDDLRDSVAIPIIQQLRRLAVQVTAYDPLVGNREARRVFGPVDLAGSVREASSGSDCLVVLTDHQEFEKMDLAKLSLVVSHPAAIVDGRQVIDPESAAKAGFLFFGIGHSTRVAPS